MVPILRGCSSEAQCWLLGLNCPRHRRKEVCYDEWCGPASLLGLWDMKGLLRWSVRRMHLEASNFRQPRAAMPCDLEKESGDWKLGKVFLAKGA